VSKKEIKHPEKGDRAGGGAYSAGVELDGWVYVSGHGPVDMASGKYVQGSIEEETQLTLRNVQLVLEQAGCTLNDIVKSTAHLASIDDFANYNRAYREFFKDVPVLPARTTVQSVLWGGMKVEIDVIARKPRG
jgi:2-iminobutanoate/2-iminopropanoate deaminase